MHSFSELFHHWAANVWEDFGCPDFKMDGFSRLWVSFLNIVQLSATPISSPVLPTMARLIL